MTEKSRRSVTVLVGSWDNRAWISQASGVRGMVQKWPKGRLTTVHLSIAPPFSFLSRWLPRKRTSRKGRFFWDGELSWNALPRSSCQMQLVTYWTAIGAVVWENLRVVAISFMFFIALCVNFDWSLWLLFFVVRRPRIGSFFSIVFFFVSVGQGGTLKWA